MLLFKACRRFRMNVHWMESDVRTSVKMQISVVCVFSVAAATKADAIEML